MKKNRVWLILDEWSSIPLELQPYLADLLRRSIFPVTNFTVKIAAIEQRSDFRLSLETGDYVGVELGADITADLNFDDFMVFDNDASRAGAFFRELLYKHIGYTEEFKLPGAPKNAAEMIQQGFTQSTAFDEFVRASEGVPRDAINVISMAAQRALDELISVKDVRGASVDWYQRDKEAAVRERHEAHDLLHWIRNDVIGKRKARAFLLQSGTKNALIDFLFDARVLHVLKRNISSKEQVGLRYDVYKLDYGCYVELISTAHAPQGLLPAISDSGKE